MGEPIAVGARFSQCAVWVSRWRREQPAGGRGPIVEAQQFLVGITGTLVGVIGWLLVGMYIQHRLHARQARDAGRAVYFELGANHLCVFMALEYGSFGDLNRASFDRLLPELATWLPAAELQALALAYLGHAAYDQMARDPELPSEARRVSLTALLETHQTAIELLRRRVFSAGELASLNKYAGKHNALLISAAESRSGPGSDR